MKIIGRHVATRYAIVVAGLFAAGGVAAEQQSGGAASQGGRIEEVVVTAEFRPANVQDTPIAITAVTGEMLDNRAQTSLFEVANQAPNVTLKPGGQARSGMLAYIRGIGQSDFIAALEPGVGVYVDDVYYAQLTGSLLELLDVSRVEVLRGPQGTLSGRNSIGGAVKLYTNKPGEGHGGNLRVGFGSYDQIDFRGVGELTLVEDRLWARVSAAGKTRDGYVKILDYACTHPGSGAPTNAAANGCEIGRQGEKRYTTGRVALRWVASNDLEVNLIGDYLDDQSGQAPGVAIYADRSAIEAATTPGGAFINPTITLEDGTGGSIFYRDHAFVPYGPNRNPGDPINDPYVTYGTTADFGQQYIAAGVGGTVPVTWKPTVLPSRNYITQWGLSGQVDWDLTDDLSLVSITAYREYDTWSTWDEDASPVAVNMLDNKLKNWQFTQELRLNGSFRELDYTVGAFYLDQKSTYKARVDLNYALIDFIHGPDPTPADTKAAFAHGAWHMTDRLTLSAGLRYSEEFKGYTHLRHNPDGSDVGSFGPTFPGAPDLINIRLTGVNGLHAEFKDERTDWRVALDYGITDDMLVYTSASTGYKSGGVNPRPFFPQQLQTFTPETLTSYEVGFKSTLLNQTLRLNGAVFYTEYDDIQLILGQCEVPAFVDPDGIAAPCLKPANVGDAEIRGFELEAEWYLTDNLLIDGSLSVLDFEYTDVDPLALQGSEIDPLDMITPYTPEDKWALGVQYTFPTNNFGEFMARVDANYLSDQYADPTNKAINKIEDYTLVNAVLRWNSPDGDWRIEGQVSNLTDKVYYIDLYDVSGSQGTVLAQPGLPRTFNVSFQVNF